MSYKIDGFDDIAEKAIASVVPIRSLEELSYAREYEILIKWFASNKDSWTSDLVRLGSLAIYGWMPTILRAEGRGDASRGVDFAEIAQDLNSSRFSACNYDFLNGSYVGTSKFLHFWSPTEFAIWDSRICKILHGHPRANSRVLFENYIHDIKKYCKSRKMNIRDVEFALFRAGQSDGKI